MGQCKTVTSGWRKRKGGLNMSNQKEASSVEDTSARSAMKLALEALKSISEMVDYEGNGFKLEYEIKALEEALEQEQGEPVAFKIYLPKVPRQDVNHGLLPWVYDQDPSSGNVASMWVTPVQTLRSKT